MVNSELLTTKRIDLESVVAQVRDPKAGGMVLFVGTVRDNSDAGAVDLIRYEAYAPMAETHLQRIQDEVKEKWPETNVKLVHRTGELAVGEVSVAVAVSAPHRAEAFEACRHAIERIKHDVPIWKKERLADGSEAWVEGRKLGQAQKRVRRAKLGAGRR